MLFLRAVAAIAVAIILTILFLHILGALIFIAFWGILIVGIIYYANKIGNKKE